MIFDHTHVSKLIQQFDSNIPRIRAKVLEMGGTVNDAVWIDIQQAYERVLLMKNPFIKEYYASSNIMEIYTILESDSFDRFDDVVKGNYNKLKSYMGRVSASYDFNVMNRLGSQMDPVSALVKLIDVSIRLDSTYYDNTTCAQEWLDHNYDYLSKIGFSSNYYYDLLKVTREGYDRFVEINLSEEEVNDTATALILLQQTVLNAKLSPLDLDQVQVKALENNNASAESFVGYGNLRDDATKEAVIKRSKYIKDFGTLDDIFPFSQLHRIQSGGNIIFDYLTLDIDPLTGNHIYSYDQLISAVSQIVAERGHSTIYLEKEPYTLPELQGDVISEQLPESFTMREMLVNAGQEPALIMDTFSKTSVWMYNYKVSFPNVFTLIGDKYGEQFPELSDKIYTKHRSVKAAGPDITRVVQSYIYPIMEHLNTLKTTVYGSLVSQWAHPDYLKRMLSNILVTINTADLYEVIDNDLNIDEAIKFNEEHAAGYDIVSSADDKKGFDNFQSIINLWGFFTTYLSIPFEVNDENTRLFKIILQQVMFPVLLTPEGIHIYDTIIPSGAGVTSIWGTHNSNKAGLVVQGSLLRSLPASDENEDSQPDDVIVGVEVPAPADNEELEESHDGSI